MNQTQTDVELPGGTVVAAEPSKPRRWRWLAPVALFVCVVAVYAPSVRNGFVYDDQRVIIEQTAPRSVRELVQLFREPHFPGLPYYRPVTRLTLLVQKALHGDRPAPFHLFNTVLMGVAAVLAYGLLRLPAFGVRPSAAWLASAAFALHPVASSCVYPIASGRETLLPAVWILASVGCFLRRGAAWHAISMIAFAAALFCKEQAVIVPVLFVAADILGLSAVPPGRSVGRWARRYWPVPVILILYFAIRTRLFGGGEYVVSALGNPTGVVLSFVYPFQMIVAPFAALVYEPPAAIWLSVPRLIVAGVVLARLLVLVVKVEASVRAAIWFWIGWFVVTLLPTANLLEQETRFAERYVFLAALALLAAVAALGSAYGDRRGARPVLVVAGAAVVVAWAGIGVHRGMYFKDSVAFYEQWLRTNPAHPAAHNNLGIALARGGKPEQAKLHFSEAVRLRDDFPEAHYNLANMLVQEGDMAGAAEHYERALELGPDQTPAATKLGVVLAATGQWGRAIAAFRKAHEAVPDNPDMAANLARILATCPVSELRDGPTAVRLAEGACRATSYQNARCLDTLAAAYAEVGRFTDAVATARRAVYLAQRHHAPAQIARQMKGRLRLYESGQPYRESR